MSEGININVTMSLDEYFSHARERGQRFITIDEDRRKQITSQQGWETTCFIEDIECPSANETLLRLRKLVYKLWPLDEWNHHKMVDVELVKEKKISDDKLAAENHRKLIAWKQEAFKLLVAKGRVASEANNHIACCIDPLGRIKLEDFEDDIEMDFDIETMMEKKVIKKSKESKRAEKIKTYYQLRKALKWPFDE